MKNIKKIIIIILLVIIFKKLFYKKKIEKFDKIGFYKIQDSGCKNYNYYKLDSILSTEVGCYNACKNNMDCGEYFFRKDSNHDYINGKPINCYLVDKNKGKCDSDNNTIYEHYIKKDIDTTNKQSLTNYINSNIQLKDVTTLWSLLLDPKTAGSEGIPFSEEELQIYNDNNINYNLFKHLNNNWYYDSKRLCVGYGNDNIEYDLNNEECKWTVGIQGYWFKDIIDSKDSLEEAKRVLINTKFGYAITYHPDIGEFGKYFIHSSSINLDEDDENYNRINTYFYLPRNTLNNSSDISVLSITPELIFRSETIDLSNQQISTPSPIINKINNQENRYILKINNNNDTIFIGDFVWNNYKGRIGIYKYSNKSWNHYTYINGNKENSYFGYSLDVGGLSNYEVLVVGAYYEDGDNQFDHVGKVHIYTINNNRNWKNPYYTNFKWGNPDEHFGKSVSLNYDGTLLAVGADGAVINDKQNIGKITIWKSNNINIGSWILNPTNTLVGNSNIENDKFGYNIKFSGNGKILLISSKANLNIGNVNLYSYENDSLSSNPLLILKGKYKDDNFGCSMDINYKADIFVIGAHQNNNNKGYVNIYNKSFNKYSIVPVMKFYGKENNDNFGYSVSLNKNSDYLTISSKNANNNKGSVKIYKSSNNYWNSIEIASINNDQSIYNLFGTNIIISQNANYLGISYFFNKKPIFNIYNIPPSENQSNAYIVPPNKTNYGMCVLKNKLCNKNMYYCAGGNYYGNHKLQRRAILQSASDILKNKPYRNCPNLINVPSDSNIVGIIINPLEIVIKEDSKSDINMVLTSKPSSDVRLIITTSIFEEIILSHDLIIFNKNNWNLPQKLLISAINDYLINQDKYIYINFNIFSEDLNYNSLQDIKVRVLKINDDKPDIIVSPMVLSIDEGKTGKIDVFLKTKPEKNVIIKIVNKNVNQLNLYNEKITFTNENWNSKQHIKFQGIIDNNLDGNQIVELLLSFDSDDQNYKNIDDKIIKVKVLDNNVTSISNFSHKCNLCTCLPNDPNNCKCESCIRINFNKLYEGNPDISENKLRKIISNFLNRNNNLKKVNANTERLHFLFNINRFFIQNGSNIILIDKTKYINNREFQEIIKNCIKNIFNIDFFLTKKDNINNNNIKQILATFGQIYNLDKYYYLNKFVYKHTFSKKSNEYDIISRIFFVYNSNEKKWILLFHIILPITLHNV
jgi:hypothetical protein